jgi:tetratricopeptide repeat protein 8
MGGQAKTPIVASIVYGYKQAMKYTQQLIYLVSLAQALDLAALATEASAFKDWWWKYQLGKCYYRLGLFRDAEKQFRSSIKQQPMIVTFLHLGLVCVRLDQPLAAVEVYNEGLGKFPKEVRLLTGIARIHEGLNELGKAVRVYKDLLLSEATNVEAIACVGLHHFYNDQPELGLRFYR